MHCLWQALMLFNEKQIKKFEKWNQLKDSTYYPFIKVTDLSSTGVSSIIRGFSTGRNHHTLSGIETSTFLLLDWQTSVKDIKEQYALDPVVTEQIANEAKIKHPSFKGELAIMSSDFVVETNEPQSKFALQIKPHEKLKEPRVIEKLEIERRYWARKNIPWFVVTEREIPETLTNNVKWLQSTLCEITQIPNLEEKLEFLLSFSKKVDLSETIVDVSKQIDSAYGLEIGETLSEIRQLIAWRHINVDLTKKINYLTVKDFVDGAVISGGEDNAIVC